MPTAAAYALHHLRPARMPVPPLPPFEALDAMHRQMLLRLEEMTALATKAQQHGVDATIRLQARELCEFFRLHARVHHDEEERVVFPPLLASGNEDLVHAVRRLQQDHGWIEQDWRELAPQLEAIADGHGGVDLDLLGHGIAVFTALYRDHIALEESLVYPASRQRHAELLAGRQRRIAGKP
jgi:hemerythrin-like domain-containing protein